MREKKCLWSRDVRWPASIFPSSRFTFSSSKKLNFLILSNIRQVPNILVFLSSCTRPTSFACFWREERCPCSSSTESRRRMFGPGEEFLGAQSTTIFFFFSINGSSKESKLPRLIQEYFSCLFFFFRWRASILLNCSSVDNFVFFSSSESPCGNLDYLTGLFVWSDVVELETQEKKFDCDNYSWRKTRKTKRTCWQVWIFVTLTRWLSTMMRKDFRLNFFFGLYLLDDLLGVRKCRICLLRRNLFADSENYFRRRIISSSEADGRFSFF